MEPKDEIARVLRAFEAAWAQRDGAAVARLFTPGAIFTTPTFERAIGREAIARAEQQAYDTYFRDTRVELEIEHLTLLRDDVALLHTGNRIVRDGGLLVESHAMVVLERAGPWLIAGWHNLVPLQIPPP